MKGLWKVFLPLAIWVVFLSVGYGDFVTFELAEKACSGFLRWELSVPWNYRIRMGLFEKVQVVDGRPLTAEGGSPILAYVFELSPPGYIVVTSDDCLVPVIAYSYSSPFSWEEVPENILLWMLRADLALRLEAVRLGLMSHEVIQRNRAEWATYLNPLKPMAGEQQAPTVYGPWLSLSTTWPYETWHQGSPYNDLCPWDSVCGGRAVVGCVATALAQILNYWQYPTSVTFYSSDSYYTEEHGFYIYAPSANFTGLDYNECNPSDQDKAKLSFAAGVSVRMDYCSQGSGAVTAQVAPALAGSWYPWSNPVEKRWDYYSADLRTYNSSYSWWGWPWYTSETDFYDQLSADMTLARPVEMAISGDIGGHAIVVDGWQEGTREYHLNFGWGGSTDGWYVLPSGLPAGFTIIKYVVRNIVPTTTTHTLTIITTGTGSGTVSKVPNQSTFTHGTHVILEAIPDSGSTFVGWSGDVSGTANPIRVVMDADKTVTATFSSGGVGPANDDFSDAEGISGTSGTVSGSNVNATKEPGEPAHAGNSGGASIWYRWTAPGTGTVAFDTYGSDFDTLLAVYTGTSVDTLTEVASNDDSGGTLQSEVEFSTTGGTTYHIAVDGYGGAQGNVVLNWSWMCPPPTNDDFANSQPLSGDEGAVSGSNECATKEPGEPAHAGNSGGASIWYRWTAPYSGDFVFGTYGSDFDTLLAVYTGTSVDTLTEVASNDDSGGTLQSRVEFTTTAGTVYHIAVDGYGGAQGNVTVGWAPNTGAVFRVERATGDVKADGSYYGSNFVSGSADVAEWVPVSELVEPGDVLEIDPENPGHYRKARGPCSQLVAGVVSTEPGFVIGHGEDTEGKVLLALMGIVPVKVTDEGGPIRPGDLLVVSSTPGYAMRWDPDSGLCGFVGKALEPWEEGEGVVLVLLMR